MLLSIFFIASIDPTDGREAMTPVFLPLSKSTVFEHSSPRISYTALTSNSAIFNNDVQINSTIELSSSQSCNQSFSNIDYPTIGPTSYFTKRSPKTVATVSESFLPLESSVTNCFKTYSASSDVPTLSYGSFEKHFLWNTSLFCSQTRSINQETVLNPVIDTFMHRNQQDNIQDDNRKKTLDNKIYINQSNHSRNLSITSNKKAFRDELNPTYLTIKPNPYSIEEILKKPVRNLKLERIDPHENKIDYHEKPHSADIECNNQGNDLNFIHKKSRINFKIYDKNA